MNIVLFGFMGAGKTSAGKLSAKLLKMSYLSTDDEIVKKENRPIKDIFEKEGEPYFRMVEKEVVKDVSAKDNTIIDTGGGVIINDENAISLKKNGILILLWAREDILFKRIQDNKERPLLNVDEKKSKIEELLKNRKPLYDKIPFKIDTSDKSIESVVEEVIKIFKANKRT